MYGKLNPSLREIRLLSPVPSSGAKNSTFWKWTIFSLNAAPPFAALSYLWGDAAKTIDIELNSQSVAINPGLAFALNHVQRQWQQYFPSRDASDFYLWADALCINQGDVDERAEQVKLMRHLYPAAEVVMGSLGPEHDHMKAAIDTLHLVYGEIKNLDEDGPLEENLEWMKKHPSLIEADVGQAMDQFEANYRWRTVRGFLHLFFWRRVWVVQELVLARQLLFFSETQTLNPDALFTALTWTKRLRQIVKEGGVSRPSWLIPSVWNFLTYDNLLGWKSIWSIDRARNADREDRCFRLLMSCSGRDLQATDPRDYIYGLGGLTKVDVEPDYSPNSSLGELYANYITWWLEQVDKLHAEDPDWTLNYLDLLVYAGSGHVDKNDKENMKLVSSVPSWAPDYPLQSKIHVPQVVRAQKNAEANVFPDDAPTPRVDRLSLFVPTIVLDSIVKMDKFKTIVETHGVLDYILSYMAVNTSHPSGQTCLQGIFRTFMRDIIGEETDMEHRDIMIRWFSFIHAIIHDSRGLTPMEVLNSLGFSTVNEAEFAQSVVRVYCLDVEPKTMGWTGAWLPMLLQQTYNGAWQDPQIWDLSQRVLLEIKELEYLSIAQTSKGYLAVVPVGTQPGDQVCLMKGSDGASVIRGKSKYWEHVGRCYSFGLSEERSEDFEAGMPGMKVLEFR